jgi:hypothetical protein
LAIFHDTKGSRWHGVAYFDAGHCCKRKGGVELKEQNDFCSSEMEIPNGMWRRVRDGGFLAGYESGFEIKWYHENLLW